MRSSGPWPETEINTTSGNEARSEVAATNAEGWRLPLVLVMYTHPSHVGKINRGDTGIEKGVSFIEGEGRVSSDSMYKI